MILAVSLAIGIAACAACQLVVRVPASDVWWVVRRAVKR